MYRPMPDMMTDYSTKKISTKLLVEIKKALKSVKAYGSVEIYVQNGNVSQITIRNIKKTTGTPITKL
jgi:hypothetical protein